MMKIASIIQNILMLSVLVVGAFGLYGEPYTTYASNMYNFWFCVYLYFALMFILADKDGKIMTAYNRRADKIPKLRKIFNRLCILTAAVITLMVGWYATAIVTFIYLFCTIGIMTREKPLEDLACLF